MPKSFEIDHKDKDPTNDRISNLRLTSHECNMKNCSVSKRNSSGICGVAKTKNGKWIAKIHSNKAISLGTFNSKIDAAKARYNAELEYGFLKCQTDSSAYNYLNAHNEV